MSNKFYSPPRVVRVGNFSELTNGLPWGRCRDLFGGRTPICL